MITYLVTGGAGFIGSNFIHYLLKNRGTKIQVINLDNLTYAGNLKNLQEVEGYANYHFIKGDICDAEIVGDIMEVYDIDYIVHFAAESHVDRSIKDSEVFAKTNIMGTLNLLNYAKKSWETTEGFKEGKRFLYVSTDEVYGELGKEGYFTEYSPLAPRNPYSASKASADIMAKAYYETYHFPVVITRCSNNYGPRQFPEKLIPLYINNGINHKSLPVYGDGSAVRDWIHVDDHCKGIDYALTRGKLGEAYNIGGHNEKTTLEIAEIIAAILNTEYNCDISSKDITFVADRKGHDRRYAIDASKINKELGWTPDIDFEEGIKETIAWYMKQQDYIKDVHTVEGLEG